MSSRRRFQLLIAFGGILALLPLSAALAQKSDDEGPVGIFNSRAEYYQFMGDAKNAAYGEGGTAEMQAMIPMINDIVLNQPIGSTSKQYNDQSSTVGLLTDDKIRSELEMSNDQFKELQTLNQEIQKRAGEKLRALDFTNKADLVSQIRAIRDRAEGDLNSVLLPHQMERLKQLRSQSLLRHRSIAEVLTSEPLKTDLDISDEQSDELLDAEKEIEAELEKEIAELRKKAREKLIAKLSVEQQEKVNELFGDLFDFTHDEKSKRKSAKSKKKR